MNMEFLLGLLFCDPMISCFDLEVLRLRCPIQFKRYTTCELQVERETFMKEGLEFQPLSTGLVLSHREE